MSQVDSKKLDLSSVATITESKRRAPKAALAGLLCAAFALSLLWLKISTAPFIWLGITCAIALLGGMRGVEGSWPRAILFNLSLLALILALVEGYFWHQEGESPKYADGYHLSDDVLGFAPARPMKAHSTRTIAGHKLYDVTYSIGSDGLRASSSLKAAKADSTVLFFGGSFTYGEGLQDSDTLPYLVDSESAGSYRTFNFGFHGYGAHQMLAAVEHGMVSRIVDTTPGYAIYVAIPDHVTRVAGRTSYGKHAPRYLRNSDGSVRRAGHFDDDDPVQLSFIHKQLHKSAAYRVLSNRESPVSEADVSLFLAVVLRSRELLRTQYPGLQFHVILWPDSVGTNDTLYSKVRTGLMQTDISVHLVTDIWPDYYANPAKYLISVADGHPNALANRHLAQYILTKIISH